MTGSASLTLDHIIATLRMMNRILLQETQCIEKADFNGLEALQPKKEECIGVISAMRHYVLTHPALLQQAATDEVNELKKLSQEFDLVVKKNSNLLQSLMQERVFLTQNYHDVLHQYVLERSGYNELGRFGNSCSGRKPMIEIAMTFNSAV